MSARPRQAVLRHAVFERDHGVCAACGIDTETLKSSYRAAKAQEYGSWRYDLTMAAMRLDPAVVCVDIAQRHRGQIKAIDDRLRRLGFSPSDVWWHCHHDQALAEGGPDTADACITLCVPCHARETAALAGRLARRPSKRVRRAA